MANKSWKEWDVFLIDAWKKDARMSVVARQFLSLNGVSAKELKDIGPKEAFARVCISMRSPKHEDDLQRSAKEFIAELMG